MAAKVDSTSFIQIPVTSRSPLKKVLESKKMKFEKGKAFYEMTKSEIIQASFFRVCCLNIDWFVYDRLHVKQFHCYKTIYDHFNIKNYLFGNNLQGCRVKWVFYFSSL